MVLVNGGLAAAELAGKGAPRFQFEDHLAAIVLDEDVVVEKGAGILGDRIESASQGRKGLAEGGVGMGSRMDVWPGFMDGGMQHKGGPIDGPVAIDHLSGMVHQNQITHPHEPKGTGKGVDPEMVWIFRIAHGDMAGHAFAKARASKHPQGPGQVAEPIAPFLGPGCELGRTLVNQGLGNEL